MKKEGWRSALHKELSDSRDRVWKWGYHDCVNLGARCAAAQTGIDYLSRISKYVYGDARTAAALIRDVGLMALIESELGKPIPWMQCGIGDLVFCGDDKSLFKSVLTVHDGAQLIGPAAKGIRRVDMNSAVCGWRIV